MNIMYVKRDIVLKQCYNKSNTPVSVFTCVSCCFMQRLLFLKIISVSEFPNTA